MLTALVRYTDPYLNTLAWRRPLNVHASGFDFPQPPSVDPSKTFRSLYSTAACAVLSSRPALLISFIPSASTLRLHGTPEESHDWLGLSRIGFTWRGDSPRVRSCTFHLSAKLLQTAKDLYGDFDPDHTGHWLGALLHPRRRFLSAYASSAALLLLIALGDDPCLMKPPTMLHAPSSSRRSPRSPKNSTPASRTPTSSP